MASNCPAGIAAANTKPCAASQPAASSATSVTVTTVGETAATRVSCIATPYPDRYSSWVSHDPVEAVGMSRRALR